MPDRARAELYEQLAPYRRAHRDVRWTAPESWHLTLLFLGSVVSGRVVELRQLIDGVARERDPYPVTADQGGGRARQAKGVAWLGLSEGAGTLIEVASLMADRCPSDMVEGSPPKRTPAAHLTVVRRADEAVVQALRLQRLGPLGVRWEIGRVQLVRSFLEADGARYVTLHEATL